MSKRYPKLSSLFSLLCLLMLATVHPAVAKEPDYSTYNKVLKFYVKNGHVDYSGLSTNQQFRSFMKQLRAFDTKQLQGKDEKKAFYINLYNAVTLELIVDNYPIKSIKKLWGPWKKELYTLEGKKISLDHIEHKILRPMGDYRIHFAINCASISCPDLRSEAYTAKALDRQLNEQQKLFLNDSSKGVTISGSKAKPSKIFSWFGKDFGGKAGVLKLIQKHHPKGAKVKKIRGYQSYNWNLNGE